MNTVLSTITHYQNKNHEQEKDEECECIHFILVRLKQEVVDHPLKKTKFEHMSAKCMYFILSWFTNENAFPPRI